MRVISNMPKWEPGISKSETVNVKFRLPIIFRLSTEDNSPKKTKNIQKLYPIEYETLKPTPSFIIIDDEKMEKEYDLDTTKVTTSDDEEVIIVVDKHPEYSGGNKAMMSFLSDQTYEVSKNGFQGRIITTFIVNKDASISDIKAVKGYEEALKREAIRIISEMPKWNPGIENGEAVNVIVTMPIVFRLPN